MTEFFDLGKHCCVGTCRQKDFLPFTCTHCNKHYCSEHRECASHQCVYNIDEELRKSHIPTCPMCNQLVPKRFPNEDNNIVIERHIRSGCKVESESNCCAYHDCKEDQMVKCNLCTKSYCSFHRHVDDHHCTHKKQQKENVKIEKKQKPEPNALLKRLHQERTANVNNSTKKTSIPKSKSNDTSTSIVVPSNSSTIVDHIVPMKNKTLHDDDSIKTTVYLTLNQSKGVPMKLSKMWSAGKTLDILADYAKLKNTNNNLQTAPEDRLTIYKINSGISALDISKRIGDLLQNGDVLILDTKRNIESSEKSLDEFCVSVNPCGRESSSFLDKLKRNYKQIFTQ